MQNILVVVDMQKDFIDGALGTKEAVHIVPAVKKMIEQFINAAEAGKRRLIFTRDTHFEDYLDTQEGKKLPVKHCISGTDGWQICDELIEYTDSNICAIKDENVEISIFDKPTFGSTKLAEYLSKQNEAEQIESITIAGLCTDICVISNAMLIKAFLPEIEINIAADCCAGVTPDSHNNAIEAMKMCQINII